MSDVRASLDALAHSYAVQPEYLDNAGIRRVASDEALVLVLRSLGAPLESPADAVDALRERESARSDSALEPVIVAWEGVLDVTCAPDARSSMIILEDGRRLRPALDAGRLTIPGPLPLGYHRLELDVGRRVETALVIAAPRRARPLERTWGIFAPLYALASERSWGSADTADLAALLAWTERLGGSIVGTLPLHAAFLGDELHDPSPYRPVSRLFYNELFLNVTALPELDHCPAARERIASSAFQREIEASRRAPLVDYRAQMALKRSVLEPLARVYFERSPPTELAAAADRDNTGAYARFRAAVEKYESPWAAWPDGAIASIDPVGDSSARYHLYVQTRMREQLLTITQLSESTGLYLDLPLGVHPDGYDAWAFHGSFVDGCSAGAPPDDFFSRGQDWGFSPLDPEALRRRGYDYFIASIRHPMQLARILRVDHVMGLHRVFCVPRGMSPADGVYIRYRPDELYAILCLESARQQCTLLGEDLGTVPPEVRQALSEHGIYRMNVAQWAIEADEREPFAVSSDAVACVNTHDMPPFFSYFTGADIDDRVSLDLLTPEEADDEKQRRLTRVRRLSARLGARARDAHGTLESLLEALAESDSPCVMVTLEDLWLEPKAQNVPGTSTERPNWRRKLSRRFEEFRDAPDVVEPLAALDSARRKRHEQTGRTKR